VGSEMIIMYDNTQKDTHHMKLYISETGKLPVLLFFKAIAIRQEYEYAGFG
jgi:hypothetical protein